MDNNKYILSVLIFVFACFTASSQNNEMYNDSIKTTIAFTKKGLSFTHGKKFQLNFRFRTQLRAGYYSRTDRTNKAVSEAQIRRMRLRFEGYMLSPKFEYKIQLGFANRDLDASNGSPQLIRDAIVYYKPNKSTSLGLGLTKTALNRESNNSSSELQMVYRSIISSQFSTDEDFGFFADKSFELGKQVIALKTALTTGDGRRVNTTNQGLAYTGKVDYLPLGAFTDKGDYIGGDLVFEPTPKLALGVTFVQNNKAIRTSGQAGTYLFSKYNAKEQLSTDIQTFVLDMIFKYKGWSFLNEYMKRNASNYSIKNFDTQPDDLKTFLSIPEGTAFNLQLGKMISKKDEIVFRYSSFQASKEVKDHQYNQNTKAIGYNHFFNKHKCKLQSYISLDNKTTTSMFLNDSFKNRWTAFLQLEIGI